MTERIICTASRLSTPGSWANGRKPARASKLAIAADCSSAALTPPTPKRIAAQPKSGRSSTIGVEGTTGRLSRSVGGPNTTMPAPASISPSAAASISRSGLGTTRRFIAARTPRMIAGTTPSSVRTLANTRDRQTAQYGSPRRLWTTAASANDETIGASSPAAAMKTSTRRTESKRVGASLNARTPMAAISASLQLVRKRRATSPGEKPAPTSSWMCTGSAAARHTHHRRVGTSSSAAVRMALGGHRTEVVAGGNVSARPTWAPR